MAVNIIIDSKFDDRGIKKAQADLQRMAGDAAKRVAQVGAAVAAAGAIAAGKLAVDAVKAASDFEESVNAVNVAFGEAAKGVLDIGQNAAQSMGLSSNEFNQAAVRFSAFAERVVGEGGNVAGFIGDVSQRAADFASVFNIEVSEALQVFQSGLAGEAEPLKRFGINLLQSEVAAFAMANGISESSAAMTEAEKVQARYGLLLEQTAKTAGDFANTSDSLANSQRILKAEISDLQVEIGRALLPVAKDLVTTLAGSLLPRLKDFSEFLSSPEGIEAVKDFGAQVENVVNFLLDFAGFIADNIGTIVGLGIAIAGVTVAVKLYGVAVQVAMVKTAALNATIALNPFGLLAIGIAAVTTALGIGAAALINYDNAAQETNETAEDYRDNIQAQHDELQKLNEEFKRGEISQRDYDRQVYYVTANLEEQRRKLAQTYTFTEAQTAASYRARDAAIANRIANNNLAPAIGNTGDAYYGLATAATNARLGIESVTIAEEAQRQLNYALTLGIGDQQTAMDLYEKILARVTARVKFQTVEQAEFNNKVDEAGVALGLVVPGANKASNAIGGVGSSATSATESTNLLGASIEQLGMTMADGVSASDDFLDLMNGIAEVEPSQGVGDMTREIHNLILELDRADELIRKEGGLFEFMQGDAKITAEFDEFGNLVRSFTDPGETPARAVTGETVDINAITKVFNSEYSGALQDFAGGTQQILDTVLGQVSFVNPETGQRTSAAGLVDDAFIARMEAQGYIQKEDAGLDAQEVTDLLETIGKEVGVDVKLAKGGLVTSPTKALIGEAGPEAVIPLSRMGQMGATYNIYVEASNRTGGAQAGEEVVAALKNYNSTNGDFNRQLTGFGA